MGPRVRENNTMTGSYHSHSQTARRKNEIAYTPYLNERIEEPFICRDKVGGPHFHMVCHFPSHPSIADIFTPIC